MLAAREDEFKSLSLTVSLPPSLYSRYWVFYNYVYLSVVDSWQTGQYQHPLKHSPSWYSLWSLHPNITNSVSHLLNYNQPWRFCSNITLRGSLFWSLKLRKLPRHKELIHQRTHHRCWHSFPCISSYLTGIVSPTQEITTFTIHVWT